MEARRGGGRAGWFGNLGEGQSPAPTAPKPHFIPISSRHRGPPPGLRQTAGIQEISFNRKICFFWCFAPSSAHGVRLEGDMGIGGTFWSTFGKTLGKPPCPVRPSPPPPHPPALHGEQPWLVPASGEE